MLFVCGPCGRNCSTTHHPLLYPSQVRVIKKSESLYSFAVFKHLVCLPESHRAAYAELVLLQASPCSKIDTVPFILSFSFFLTAFSPPILLGLDPFVSIIVCIAVIPLPLVLHWSFSPLLPIFLSHASRKPLLLLTILLVWSISISRCIVNGFFLLAAPPWHRIISRIGPISLD